MYFKPEKAIRIGGFYVKFQYEMIRPSFICKIFLHSNKDERCSSPSTSFIYVCFPRGVLKT